MYLASTFFKISQTELDVVAIELGIAEKVHRSLEWFVEGWQESNQDILDLLLTGIIADPQEGDKVLLGKEGLEDVPRLLPDQVLISLDKKVVAAKVLLAIKLYQAHLSPDDYHNVKGEGLVVVAGLPKFTSKE